MTLLLIQHLKRSIDVCQENLRSQDYALILSQVLIVVPFYSSNNNDVAGATIDETTIHFDCPKSVDHPIISHFTLCSKLIWTRGR